MSDVDVTTALFFGLGGICSVLLTIFGVAAAMWKIALPWLREQIVKPVQESNATLTKNHHSSPEPTVLDRFEDLSSLVESLEGTLGVVALQGEELGLSVESIRSLATRIGIQFEAHLLIAANTDASYNARLIALENERNRP